MRLKSEGWVLTSPRVRLPPLLQPLSNFSQHVRLHYAETRQASSWQQLWFWSEWFLSQTIKLVKMSHLVCKPLTTSSFPLADELSVFFLVAPLRSLSLPLIFLCLSFCPLLLGNELKLFLFYFTASFMLSFNLLMYSHNLSSSFFTAHLKGLLRETSRDEERHAGWFPFSTYLQVMDFRKSDPSLFKMTITNPFCAWWHFLERPVGGGRAVHRTEWQFQMKSSPVLDLF